MTDFMEINRAGLICAEKRDFQGAVVLFEKALGIRSDPVVLFNLANVYREMGKLYQAIENYLKSLIYAPQYTLTRNTLLECLERGRSIHCEGEPNIAELLVKFRDEMGWGDVLENPSSIKQFLHLYEAACWCTQDSVVLDVSAGFCRNKDFFSHAQYVSIDLIMSSDWNWDFSKLDLIGDALNLPIRGSSIDLIINSSSLEHYSNPFSAFHEFSRILKTGGMLYLDVPFSYIEHQIPHDYFRFSRYGLNHLCRQYGLEVLSITPDVSLHMGGYRMFFEVLNDYKNIAGLKENFPDRIKAIEEVMKCMEEKIKPIFIENDQHPLLCREGVANDIQNCTQYPIRYNLVARKPGELPPDRCYPSRSALLMDIVECPFCHAAQLQWHEDRCQCPSCKTVYYLNENGIPRLVS